MEVFFENRFLFWYGFMFSFIFCTGAGALIQCWFLIKFCNIESKVHYYVVNVLISYAIYIFALSSDFYISPMFDTLLGAGILFIFVNKLLKQNYVLSAIAATVTMAVITLVESILLQFQYLAFQFITLPQNVFIIVDGLLFLPFITVLFHFFITRYSVTGRYQSKYFLAFSFPIFFIAAVLRLVNHVRYAPTKEDLLLQSASIANFEMVMMTVMAFFSICIVLFAYEKIIQQVENEAQRTLLETQVLVQKNYVTEAKQKYEATKAFRHDFKNHIIALRGLINLGDMEKVSSYMERFEQTYEDMTFPIDTGNSVVNILLGEKLSYAEQLHISIKCDINISSNVTIDDFDLCAIFANALDNAIKACSTLESGAKSIDIVAKSNNNFFVIDLINPYQEGSFPKGNGIGLTTIKLIAKKYQGAVEISRENNIFRISVILPFVQIQPAPSPII